MIDKKYLEELDKIDTIISSLNNIINSIYCKIKSTNLDADTIAFLIYKAESLQKIQLELKDKNIEFIKEFIPYTSERSRLLCDTMAEKSHMEQNFNKTQEEIIKYFYDSEDVIEPLTIKN